MGCDFEFKWADSAVDASERKFGYSLTKDKIIANVLDLQSEREELKPLLAERGTLLTKMAQLRSFIKREESIEPQRVSNVQTSIKDKIGGLVKGLFKKNNEIVAKPASSEKVALAKSYLSRMEVLYKDVARDIGITNNGIEGVMPNQRFDSMDAIQMDMFKNRTASYELSQIIGIKEPLSRPAVNESNMIDDDHHPVEVKARQFIANTIINSNEIEKNTPHLAHVISMGRMRAIKELKTAGVIGPNKTQPSATKPTASSKQAAVRHDEKPHDPAMDMLFPKDDSALKTASARMALSEIPSALISDNLAKNPNSIIWNAKAEGKAKATQELTGAPYAARRVYDMIALEKEERELSVREVKIEDKIASLEKSSFFSKVGSFMRGNSVGSQIKSLNEEKARVVARCTEVTARMEEVRQYEREIAA